MGVYLRIGNLRLISRSLFVMSGPPCNSVYKKCPASSHIPILANTLIGQQRKWEPSSP